MINIQIRCDEEKVTELIDLKDTTLIENAIVIRRLQEIILDLLSIDYQPDLEMEG